MDICSISLCFKLLSSCIRLCLPGLSRDTIFLPCFLCFAFSAFYCRSIGKLLYSVLYTVSSPFPIFYAQNFQTGLIQSQFS
ncbi:UNVERIFIED_ORG: hypothetical protein B5F06_07640 [Lacrimispora saccharolytica]